MIKIINRTSVDEEILETFTVHKNSYNIEIDIGENKTQFITLSFEYQETADHNKSLYRLGVGNEDWVRDPLEEDNSNAHNQIFDFVSDFVDDFFNDFGGRDKNIIHGEIMGEIENYCHFHNINGIE